MNAFTIKKSLARISIILLCLFFTSLQANSAPLNENQKISLNNNVSHALGNNTPVFRPSLIAEPPSIEFTTAPTIGGND